MSRSHEQVRLLENTKKKQFMKYRSCAYARCRCNCDLSSEDIKISIIFKRSLEKKYIFRVKLKKPDFWEHREIPTLFQVSILNLHLFDKRLVRTSSYFLKHSLFNMCCTKVSKAAVHHEFFVENCQTGINSKLAL